eukprot:CAMPEP_0170493216 /NCGR_PEP_ID=MMETSP0208-20121228/13532_1 /TAXON_ID=197538 /ORGANISM="Strombidium inclinatum, Strain S3" /LENGTH=112 /DNA_ID=CAMNT_0010769109 /DNA_START=306 /DNA_END=644 /DNA_ORIENTATION=+
MVKWAQKGYDKLKEDNPEETEAYDDYVDQVISNIKSISFALLIFTGILGLTILSGWCYRESTLDKTFERTEKLLAQKQMEKSQQEMERAITKNLEKRAYYEQKYPELAGKKK